MTSVNRGFSLVELLAVVLIIGLGISLVSFNIGGNNSYRLRIEAKQFANNVSLIAEEAVLRNQQWGVDLFRLDATLNEAQTEQFGYRWLVRNEEGLWELANVDNNMAVEFLFAPGIGLRLQLDGIDEEQSIEFKRDIAVQDSVLATEEQDDTRIIDDQGLVEEQRIEPAIWLLSSGEMNTFVLTIFNQDDLDRDSSGGEIKIEGDVLGRITVVTGAEDNAED